MAGGSFSASLFLAQAAMQRPIKEKQSLQSATAG
jgi:hypothetical protein